MLLYCFFLATSHSQKFNLLNISWSKKGHYYWTRIRFRSKSEVSYSVLFLVVVTWSCYLWVDEHVDQLFWSLQLVDLYKKHKNIEKTSVFDRKKIKERMCNKLNYRESERSLRILSESWKNRVTTCETKSGLLSSCSCCSCKNWLSKIPFFCTQNKRLSINRN